MNFKRFNLMRMFMLGSIGKPVVILLAVAAFVLFNVLISPLSLRYDASSGHAYTLSLSSKKIIGSLKDKIQITFFASSDLPTRLAPLKTDVISLLEEYRRQGKNISVKVADPKTDTKAAQEAQSASIPQLQFSQLESDKYAVTAAYFGISISKGTARETIPQVTDIGSLEYNITSSIYKLTRKEVPKIGLVGETGSSLQDPYQSLRMLAGKQFNLSSLQISTGEAQIDPSYKALLILGDDTHRYSATEVKHIKDYINKGGAAAFFIDGVSVNPQAGIDQAAAPAQHGLFQLTRDYGININKDLVLSASSEIVTLNGQGGQYVVQYPFWLRVQNINSKNTLTNGIAQLTYPWVSSLTVKPVKDVQVTPLAYSSSQSWLQTTGFNINPDKLQQPKQSDLKSFIVTAEARTPAKGKILVVPSSHFLQDNFMSRASDNLGFLINVLNDYASGGALSGIRTRTVNTYPLPDLSSSQKDLFKYANILGFPLLFALYGAYRLLKRK